MKKQPSYYSIIPATVRYDDQLKANEKILYGEITSLANKHGYCWAENKYFADLYDVHKVTVSNWLSNLEKQGYIKTKLEYIQGTKQVSKRFIYINDTPISENTKGYQSNDLEGVNEKANTPISENTKEELNNTSTNNTSTNKEQSSAELTDNFETLWKLYPNKKGKKKAKASYKRAIKNGTTNKEIQDGIIGYKKHLKKNDWLNPAHGATWFNNERWEDDYETEGNNKANNLADNLWEE